LSINGGKTWEVIWYKSSDDTSPDIWISSGNIFLTDYAGSNIRLRFSFNSYDDWDNDYVGWLIDDLTITNVEISGPCKSGTPIPYQANSVWDFWSPFLALPLLWVYGKSSDEIVLLQLPVPRYAAEPVHENDPLAAGYLIGYFLELAKDTSISISILDRKLNDYGGDQAIIDAICRGGYDVVCFTLYLWNLTRSIYLAKEIKKLNPETTIIAGGPEVTQDNVLLSNVRIFDYLVFGEGEETFYHLVTSIFRNNHTASQIQGTAILTETGYYFSHPQPHSSS